MKKLKQITLLTLVGFSVFLTACTNATEGSVTVQTVKGSINRVIKPSDGWVTTITEIADDYYEVNLRSKTKEVEVQGSTKDNAAFKMKVAVTYHVKSDDDSIKAYVRKFGLDAEERDKRVGDVLSGHVNTETKNSSANFEAYGLLQNQETIVKTLTETLKPVMLNQIYLELESVQILDRPDFLDDRIEQAASQVVANSKLKEAAQAALDAAKVDAEKKQVEAQTFRDPALLQIKLLELKLDIERARAEGIAKHQGSLTIVNGTSDTQVQIRDK